MSETSPVKGDSLPLSGEERLDAVCQRFEQAWQEDQRPAIEPYLAEAPPEAQAALLRELVALDVAYRRRAGESPTLEGYRRRFPEHSTQVEKALALADAASPTCLDPGTVGDQPAPAPADGMRYRPLRPHARGGLGEVEVAEDVELHREVALKRIQGQYAHDPGSRRRFLREAEITGRLEHPGIVPVYGLVQDANGQPSYAMRFVQGETLQDAIRRYHAAEGPRRDPAERRLAQRELLGRFIAVCNTIAYAHSRGVLHRDLKPANIMLGKYGETLVVDWGLAKPFERTEAERAAGENTLAPLGRPDPAEEITWIGAVAGTPAYMSPEQAAGQWDQVSQASDIYSLGATLYEVLVNRPPLEGSSVAEVLDRARRGEFVPPRQVQRGVPPALEAICLKAMAVKPAARYATATELARDVERWLADEPIAAYPEPWIAKGRRWMRRHRLFVTGAAAALMVLAISLAVGAVLLGSANAQLRQRTIDLADEQARTQAALQAEAKRRKEAREALDAQTSFVLEDLLGRQLALTEDHQRYLRQALQAYEQFAADTGQEEESRAGVARAHWRVGQIHNRLGAAAQAEEAYRQAITLSSQLAADFPTAPAHRDLLARSHNSLGLLLRDQGKLSAASEAFQQAIALWEELFRKFPEEPEYRQRLAGSHHNLGMALNERGERGPARKAFERAIDHQEQLVKKFPTVPGYSYYLSLHHNALGKLLWEQGERVAAREAYERARALSQQLARDFPNMPEYRRSWAESLGNLSLLLEDQGDLEPAREIYGQALVLQEQLVKDYPGVPDYRSQRAGILINLGVLLQRQGKPEVAREAHERARALCEELVRDFPNMPEYRNRLAASLYDLSFVLKDQGEHGPAREASGRAIVLWEELAKEFQEVPEYRQRLAKSQRTLGTLHREQGKPGPARAAHKRAADLSEELVKEVPTEPEYRREAANCQYALGLLLKVQEEPVPARLAFERAIIHQDWLVGKSPGVPSYREGLANRYNELGMLLRRQGEREAARKAYEQSIAQWEQLAKDFRDKPVYQVGLGGGYCNFGNLMRDEDHLAEALGWYTKAIATLEPVLAKQPRLARQFLRNAYSGRARALDQLTRHAEAAKDWGRAGEYNDDPKRRAEYRQQRALSLARAGEHASAVAAANELAQAKEVSGPTLYQCARVCALAAAAVKDDPRLHEQYAAGAVALLQRAAAAEYPINLAAKKDQDLDALRGRADFQKLLQEIEQKSKPGAK